MINKRLATVSLLLVIALSASVISANSIELEKSPPSDSPTLIESAAQKQEQTAIHKQAESVAAAAAVPSSALEAKKSEPQTQAASPASSSTSIKQVEEKQAADTAASEPTAEASKRKAKSTDSASSAAPAAAAAAAEQKQPVAEEKDNKSDSAKAKSDSSAAKASSSSSSAPTSKSSAASQKQSSLSGKSGASKSKLPANLGTVTSTGSGGATHYMSKHDAYSAIAEKHGALAHDAMRKSDKRHMHSSGGNPFSSSIQKASGLGEMLNPFKGVTDSGLARTLGASMRSIMKSKYSVPAYVASALLGAVALMAFYESPISPLPVPALPNPPVGRFPPEMPNISPNVQVPFRTNQQQQYGQQQQNYNQRSLIATQQQQPQQQQQVFFPGAAQQRQMTVSPVQNLAANLLASVSGKQQQNAQRKSGLDYDPSTSRSLFGNNSPFSAPAQKAMGSPANHHQQRQSNAFLSFFGLGGGGADNQHSSAGGHQMSGSSHLEPKGTGQQGSQAGALSNSHIVNKVKSYFRAPNPSGSSSASGISNSNPYDQYQRMSFVQAFMKDTAFLPGFLTPGNRKSSSPIASGSSAAPAATPSKPASDSSSVAPSGNQQVAAAARMQTGNDGQLPKQQAAAKQGSGYGIVKVAHALLESLGSGLVQQRSSQPSERKSNSDEHQSIAAATSLLSDLVSGYNANIDQQVNQQQQQQQHHQTQQQQQQPQQAQPQPSQSTQQGQQASAAPTQQTAQQQQHSEAAQAQARSDDEPIIITADDQLFTSKTSEEKQPAAVALTRKTRSIGLDYPVEAQPEQPSRAAQINNMVDFVADSYAHNRLLFNFVMNQVGLSQAVPYVEQILTPETGKDSQ